jgi:hypothetical protein
MCYSTSSPLEKSDKNSILDVNILKSYLSKMEDYPVKKLKWHYLFIHGESLQIILASINSSMLFLKRSQQP